MAMLFATLLSLAWGSAVGGGLLLADRAYLRRKSPYGDQRMWNRVTLALALSHLFLPAPWAFGAHVWVTRNGPWPRRALLGLGAAIVATGLWLGLTVLTATMLGLPLE